MNPEVKQNLHDRYITLLTERDQFVAAANQKLGEYAGRLAELEMLLAPMLAINQDNPTQESAYQPNALAMDALSKN